MVKRNKKVSVSLTFERDGVKQKTGCRFPQAEGGAHGALRSGRKARCTRHWASSSLRDAVAR
jgi:hypothetical protein